jgi:hypothetical protein
MNHNNLAESIGSSSFFLSLLSRVQLVQNMVVIVHILVRPKLPFSDKLKDVWLHVLIDQV